MGDRRAKGSAKIDHLVLPVAALETARARLAALGFIVAPEGRHPFGTANACVFFADDSYLEPLMPADRPAYDAALAAGNGFVAGDRRFRAAHGDEGFSAFVVASADAAAADAAFHAAAVSGGAILDFARPVTLPDGSARPAGFRLAFAGPPPGSDFFAFACERVNPLPADRTALTGHANDAVGLAAILLSAERPEDVRGFLDVVLHAEPDDGGADGLFYRTGNARVIVLTPAALAQQWGIEPGAGGGASSPGGLAGRAVVVRVGSVERVRQYFDDNAIVYEQRAGRLVVPPAPGQGVALIFEE